MPFIAETRKRLGFLAFWHHTYKQDGFQLDQRATINGLEIRGIHDAPGEVGEYETGQDAPDLTGATQWKRNTRPINGVRFIWPAVVVNLEGQASGGPTTGDGGGGAATPPGGYSYTIDDGPAGATYAGGGLGGGGGPKGAVLTEDNWDGRYARNFNDPPAELG